MDFTNAQLKDLLVAAYSEITELRSSNKILTERNIELEKEYDELREDCWGPDESYISNQEWKSSYGQLYEEHEHLTLSHEVLTDEHDEAKKLIVGLREKLSKTLDQLSEQTQKSYQLGQEAEVYEYEIEQLKARVDELTSKSERFKKALDTVSKTISNEDRIEECIEEIPLDPDYEDEDIYGIPNPLEF